MRRPVTANVNGDTRKDQSLSVVGAWGDTRGKQLCATLYFYGVVRPCKSYSRCVLPFLQQCHPYPPMQLTSPSLRSSPIHSISTALFVPPSQLPSGVLVLLPPLSSLFTIVDRRYIGPSLLSFDENPV